ncbi:MAG: hypothetical protein GX921_08080, partial [Bacteroidales bacterium]|nr:hypothetical protein [Bacteroidales bacterium]
MYKRFTVYDYVAIFYTLYTLKSFHSDFVEYLISVIKCVTTVKSDCRSLIQGLAYGLYILTYENIGQPKKEELSQRDWCKEAEERSNRIVDLINNPELYYKKVDLFYKGK